MPKRPSSGERPQARSETMALMLDVSVVHLGRLAKEGAIPGPVARGRWDVIATVPAYIAYVEAKAAKRVEGSGGAKSEELQLIKARRQKTEAEHEAQVMKNAVSRGELLPASEVSREIERMVGVTRDRVRAVPSRLGPRLTPELRDTLGLELDEALEELSSARPYHDAIMRDGGSSIVSAAAEVDGVAMGGSGAPAQP